VKTVKLGIIGVGSMGTTHSNAFWNDTIKRCELVAICDIDPERLKTFDEHKEVEQFSDANDLINSGKVDAVLIATPHYSHTTIGIAALKAGLHVLTEKPISAHKADCERLIAAHRKKKQVFGAMFQQRTAATYKKLKELITTGQLGELTRINWICTTWFRTEAYFASGGWRATWKGEGGGVLLNQCPHQLDLLQWLFGMPKTVRGFCAIGKYHNIEVEDDVTAFMEYPNGATGVFTTNTAEAPGTNRLEVCGEMGKVVIEKNKLHWTRNETAMLEFLRTTDQRFGTPPVWEIDIPLDPKPGQHTAITQNFVDAILDGTPLIAPAKEGINSVELGNAMLYSSLTGKTVEMPLDSAKFERRLKKLIRESKYQKKTNKRASKNENMSTSF